MSNTYSISEAQARFPAVVREAQDVPVVITRREKIVGYLVSPERMEAILESMELLGNPKAMRILDQYEAGKLAMKPVSVLDDEE